MMKSIVIDNTESFEIREIEKPFPGNDEILIELKGNTICNRHDLNVFSGRHSSSYPLEPGFPGHEGVGTVVELGRDVGDFTPGDTVVMTGIGGPPLYSSLVTRKRDTALKVTPPSGYDIGSLACLELFGCVYHALEKVPSYEGREVAVVGLGAAGLAALQLLKDRGAKSVTGIDINREQFERAVECGADTVLDASVFSEFTDTVRNAARAQANGNWKPDAADLTKKPDRKFDIVVECTGNALSTAVSFALAREEIVIFGYTLDIIPVFQHLWFETELTVRNSQTLSIPDFSAVVELFTRGSIDPSKLVTHRMAFSQYKEALDLVRAGKAVKILMTWEQ